MRPDVRRLQELENQIERGQLVELPCKVGDTIYGVGFFDCEQGHTNDEKLKRKIFDVCMTLNGQCAECKYSYPSVEEFICTHIQLSAEPTLIVGARGENYNVEDVFHDKAQAEVRLKELQKKSRTRS